MPTPSAPIPSGTAWYPDHWPEAEWRDDLQRMRDAGLTLVRFGEFSWSWFEPQPDHDDFAAYDRFVDLVADVGLQLCLCTPTATPPPWFDRLYPDGRKQNACGQSSLSHRHFWSWHHAASWERAQAMVRKLAARYAGREHLWGWQIDNEPNYAEQVHSSDPLRGYDYSPAARTAFARWLEQTYGTLEALNAAWYTNFWSQRVGTWEEAAIPRGKSNPQRWRDFLRWREAHLGDFIQAQVALIREVDPKAYIGCNIPEAGVATSVHIGIDPYVQARNLDWVGTDLYQASGDRAADLASHAFSCDLMRSAAGPAEFLLSEAQAGPHQRGWAFGFAPEAFGPDYLEDCARTFVTHGAKQLWWFIWRPTPAGHEMGMNGLQHPDGSASPRTEVVRKLATTDNQDLLGLRLAQETKPRALLHYSRAALHFRFFWETDLRMAEEELKGWHALLNRAGYQIDMVSDEQLAALDPTTTEAEVLVVPDGLVIGEETAAALARWAARRALVAGPHLGLLDGRGHLRPSAPGPELEAIVGVRLGYWATTGRIPDCQGVANPWGVREVELAETAEVLAANGDGSSPALVGHGPHRIATVPLGAMAWAHGRNLPAGLRTLLFPAKV